MMTDQNQNGQDRQPGQQMQQGQQRLERQQNQQNQRGADDPNRIRSEEEQDAEAGLDNQLGDRGTQDEQ